MKTTKYLLAKYIPDVHRFEPRNIGVIVWSAVGAEARFLAEFPDRPGEVDGRSVPAFVTSASAYKQWIGYWRKLLSEKDMITISGNHDIVRSSVEFPHALEQTSHGNFVIVEGGELLDEISEDELPTAANQLFATLVEGKRAKA
jgi:hypothetical protein